jgi:hypothetical protein
VHHTKKANKLFKQTANSRRFWFELSLVITVALFEFSGG